jgi:hypothetical protein
MEVCIYQSYPSGVDKEVLFEGARLINYTDFGSESEYDIFKHIRTTENPDCWGLLSWKFEYKCCVPISKFLELATMHLLNGTDCYFINPMIVNEAVFSDVWEQGELIGHKGMFTIRDYLLERGLMKVSPLMDTESFAMCNFFIGNRRFWDRYFEFVDRVLFALEDACEQGLPVGKIYRSKAEYIRNSNLSMRPFIIERVFSSFVISSSDLVFKQYPQDLQQYEKKLGCNIGGTCHSLSVLKRKALKLRDSELFKAWNSERAKFFENPAMYNLCLLMDDPPIELNHIRRSTEKRTLPQCEEFP